MKKSAWASALVLAWACACSSTKTNAPGDAGVNGDVQVLSVCSWLGQLDPIMDTAPDGGTASYGGLAALSAYFAADRAANPNTLIVGNADSFGASPPLSAQFADEPAVKGLNFLGLQYDALGNHNFNDGIDPYLKHLVDVATYSYVTTNMDDVQQEVSPKVVAPYQMVSIGGASIALLGITSPEAPAHTFPGRFGSIRIREPIAAANQAAQDARAAGAQAVIALTDLETTGVDIDGNHQGPLIDFAKGLTGVDVAYGFKLTDPQAIRLGDVLVVEHVWKGRTYGRTHLRFAGGALSAVSADVVSPDVSLVTPDPKADALLAPYRAQLAQIYDEKIATASDTFPRDGTIERTQETALGDLLADAYLAEYKSVGAQIAVMNGGGIRDTVPSSYAPADKTLRRAQAGYASGPPYDVVVGDVFTVLPFGDSCVVRPITGAVLWQMLETSVFAAPSANKGYLQIAGFKFTYKASAAPGARVQSVTLDDGTPVAKDSAATILLVDNDFLDAGGDGYAMLVQPSPAPTRDVMADVLLAYLKANPQATPATSGRITQLP